MSVATAIVISAILVLIGAVTVWFAYAYKNPNSRSGLWLIQVCRAWSNFLLIFSYNFIQIVLFYDLYKFYQYQIPKIHASDVSVYEASMPDDSHYDCK